MSDQVVKTQRLDWVDDAKGFGVIFIILFHGFMFGSTVTRSFLILDTMMPMFFFLGGFTFSKKLSFKDFTIRRLKTLMIPCYVVGFIVGTLRMLHNFLLTGCYSSKYVIMYVFLIRPCPIWFFPVLCLCNIVYYFLLKVVSKKERHLEDYEKNLINQVERLEIDEAINKMKNVKDTKLSILQKRREIPILEIARKKILEICSDFKINLHKDTIKY